MVRVKEKSLWDRFKIEYKVFAGYSLFLLLFLIAVIILGCDSGWSVIGWEIK